MAHITESTYQSGPLPLMPTPISAPPSSSPQPTREKIESRMRWRRPDLKHTWLKEIKGAPGTCLYVLKSLLFYEILPIGGSRLRLGRKNFAINEVSPTIHGQLSWSSSPQIPKCYTSSSNVDTSNYACRARPAHGALFTRVPAGMWCTK